MLKRSKLKSKLTIVSSSMLLSNLQYEKSFYLEVYLLYLPRDQARLIITIRYFYKILNFTYLLTI